MNKTSGNMYSWANFTWNPIGGECLHKCIYCYMKKGRMKALKKYQGPARLIESTLEDLGKDNIIFVGSATDMWGDWVSGEIIHRVLEHCYKYDNTYLFQTKNPWRFIPFLEYLPVKVILGTTIESDIDFGYREKLIAGIPGGITRAPYPLARVWPMETIKERKMVSIEPIMDFNIEAMVDYMQRIKPEFVSIGADSKNCNLPEPSGDKIEKLICELSKFTKVKIKKNLNRILIGGKSCITLSS